MYMHCYSGVTVSVLEWHLLFSSVTQARCNSIRIRLSAHRLSVIGLIGAFGHLLSSTAYFTPNVWDYVGALDGACRSSLELNFLFELASHANVVSLVSSYTCSSTRMDRLVSTLVSTTNYILISQSQDLQATKSRCDYKLARMCLRDALLTPSDQVPCYLHADKRMPTNWTYHGDLPKAPRMTKNRIQTV